MIAFRRILTILAAIVLVGNFCTAHACDTPVYRYSIYSPRWAPSPYTIWYLYHGQEAADDEAANRLLEQAADDPSHRANVVFQRLNVANKNDVAAEPDLIQETVASRKGELPLHVVTGPQGAVLFTGRLDAEAAESLLDSPARRQLCKLLSAGKIVFLLLEGDKPADTEAASSVVRQVADLAGQGKIQATIEPGLLPEDKSADKSAANKIDVALLRISRKDAKEAWFIKLLMRVENDLEKYAAEPLVFACYGRGRALPPFATLKGITPKALEGEVRFLLGPCTCEVKNQNPGVDLLTSWDWEAAALELAKAMGDEDVAADGLPGVGALVPTLSIGKDSAIKDKAIEAQAAAELAAEVARTGGEGASAASEARTWEGGGPADHAASQPIALTAGVNWLVIGLIGGAVAAAAIVVAMLVALRRFG